MTDFTAKAHEKDPAYGWVMVFAVFLLSALALERLALYRFSSNHFRASLAGVAVKPRWGTRSSLSPRPCSGFCGAILPTALVRAGLA